MTNNLPFVFFDLGETIINLRDTIKVLARRIAVHYPRLLAVSPEIATSWFVDFARSVPRDETAPFRTQYAIGAAVLHRHLLARGVAIDERMAGAILQEAWDEWQTVARLCEGVTKEWLHRIRDLSAGVGAVTDGDEDDVHRLLERTELLGFFDSVTTSESVHAYKPSPRLYHAAMKSLKAVPERSLFVSDSVLDLVGASAVGMTAAWFRQKPPQEEAKLPSGTVLVRRPALLNDVLMHFTKTGTFALP